MSAHPVLTGGGSSNQSIFQETSAARHPVGTRACLPDGRVFYYSKNGAGALGPGKLAMAEVITAEFANQAVAAAAAVSETSATVTLGATAVTLNEYADGYLVINDAAGEGHTYKIRTHPVAAGAASCVLDLYDGIKVALTTSSQYTLVKNPWGDVVVAAAGHVHQAVGVAPIDVTAAYFFWMQTWGVCAVWDDAATAIGAPLQSGTTEGQVEVNDGAGGLLGTQLYTGVASEYYPKFLTIAP